MRRLLPFVLVLAACGGGVTTPTPAPEVASAPAVQPAPAPVPAGAPAAGAEHVGRISGATFCVRNGSAIPARYRARLYEVAVGGAQSLVQDLSSGDVKAGAEWCGAFAKLPCNYQIDLDHDFEVSGPAPGLLGAKAVQGNVCPTPTPTPTPSPTPTPPPPCTPWSKVTVTATSQESGKWSIWAGSTKLWEDKLAKGASHSESYPANGAALKLKYNGSTYASGTATCPAVGKSCTGTLIYTCGCGR